MVVFVVVAVCLRLCVCGCGCGCLFVIVLVACLFAVVLCIECLRSCCVVVCCASRSGSPGGLGDVGDQGAVLALAEVRCGAVG